MRKRPPIGNQHDIEAVFHKKVKGHLTPAQQSLVMTSFREAKAAIEAKFKSTTEETP